MTKLLTLATLFATGLSLSLSVAADTAVSMDQMVKLIQQNPKADLTADTTTLDAPVEFELTLASGTSSVTADPTAFLKAVRAVVPIQTLTSDTATLEIGYGILNVIGASANPVPVYDLLEDIQQNLAPAGSGTPDQGGYVDNTYSVLSFVGPYVSYSLSSNEFYPDSMHPNYADIMLTVDVTSIVTDESGTHYNYVNLIDIVDEASLLEALKVDPYLRKAVVTQAHINALNATKDVQQFVDMANSFLAEENACIDIPMYNGQLNSFAIYDYNPKTELVSVRIMLEAAATACAGVDSGIQLGEVVKPGESLQFSLDYNFKNKSGLLMKAAQ